MSFGLALFEFNLEPSRLGVLPSWLELLRASFDAKFCFSEGLQHSFQMSGSLSCRFPSKFSVFYCFHKRWVFSVSKQLWNVFLNWNVKNFDDEFLTEFKVCYFCKVIYFLTIKLLYNICITSRLLSDFGYWLIFAGSF